MEWTGTGTQWQTHHAQTHKYTHNTYGPRSVQAADDGVQQVVHLGQRELVEALERVLHRRERVAEAASALGQRRGALVDGWVGGWVMVLVVKKRYGTRCEEAVPRKAAKPSPSRHPPTHPLCCCPLPCCPPTSSAFHMLISSMGVCTVAMASGEWMASRLICTPPRCMTCPSCASSSASPV